MEMLTKWICKNKIMFEQKFILWYDKKIDQYVTARIRNDNPEEALILYRKIIVKEFRLSIYQITNKRF
jgi:hypothetical protein